MEKEVELTPEELEVEKAKIREGVENPDPKDGDVILPSEEPQEEERVYANNFKSVEELKKGINNLGSELPDYVLAGMNDDALEQHYIELRKDFSGKKEETPKEEPAGDKPSEAISDELWTSLDQTYSETGEITSEQYDQLNKAGIPKAVVDKYIGGLAAEQQMFTNQVFEIAGGEDEFNEIKAWAEENYTQAQLDIVASGSNDEILMKYKGVKADYLAQNGGTVTTDRVRGGKASGDTGYKSQEQYLMDVMSPEYKKDPRFKAKVKAKFAASGFAS